MSNPEPPAFGDLLATLNQLIEILNQRGGDYALIGALGAAVRGNLRATRDIDLLLLEISQLQLPPVLEALAQQGFMSSSPMRYNRGTWSTC